tara:strand:- start:16 stop:828 length:813 start_codon:yes stop_codon:yes gene_type:complete
MSKRCVFLEEWADVVKQLTYHIIPEIVREIQPKDVISYYKQDESSRGVDVDLTEMYKDTIIIYPNVPSLHRNDQLSPTQLFMLSSFENDMNKSGSLYITSFIEECTHDGIKTISEFTWGYTLSDKNNIFDLEEVTPYKDRTSFNLKELNKQNVEYRINTIIAFDKNKMMNQHKLSIQYLTYLHKDTIDNIHNRTKIIFNYLDTSSDDKCLCDIQKLGTDECSFQQFIDENCTQNILSDMIDVVFDIKEKINNDEYLKLMNKIKTLNQQIR